MQNIWILAQAGDEGTELAPGVENDQTDMQQQDSGVESTTKEDGSPQKQPGKEKPTGQKIMEFAPLILIIVIMYFLLLRGPKKKEQKHTQMVKGLQKNDKVQTIGGIIGTIVDIRENEIVLKIDESNNTKMRITKRAVANVLSDDRI